MMVKREHDIQIQNQDNTKIRNSGGIQVYKKKQISVRTWVWMFSSTLRKGSLERESC